MNTMARSSVIRSLLLACIILLVGQQGAYAKEPSLKVGVLKFGTVNWAMNVIRHHRFDRSNGFTLEVVGLASKNATSVAFLAGDVDAFVTDWFWVLRQRAEGADVVQVPYSASLGAVMVAADSPVKTLEDLKGKSIGVAGGPIDKSWLLLRAHGLANAKADLSKSASPVYAAPPLLNQQLISGRIDAVLNYWPFAARLEGAGYRRIASVAELMQGLGMPVAAPLVGFTFPRAWANDNPKLIEGFVAALTSANELLATSDAEWDRVRPLMKVQSDSEFAVMKQRYREGILASWTPEHKAAAAKLFEILKEVGGDKLTGPGTRFDPAMFWP